MSTNTFLIQNSCVVSGTDQEHNDVTSEHRSVIGRFARYKREKHTFRSENENKQLVVEPKIESTICGTILEKRHNEVQSHHQTQKIARLRGYMLQKGKEEYTINKPTYTPSENHHIPNCIDDFGTIPEKRHNEVISQHHLQNIARLRGYMHQNAKQCIGLIPEREHNALRSSDSDIIGIEDGSIPERGHNALRICDSDIIRIGDRYAEIRSAGPRRETLVPATGTIPEQDVSEVIAKHSVGIERWIRSAGETNSMPATTCARAQGAAHLFRSENTCARTQGAAHLLRSAEPQRETGPIPERGHNEVQSQQSVGIGRFSVEATRAAHLFRSENSVPTTEPIPDNHRTPTPFAESPAFFPESRLSIHEVVDEEAVNLSMSIHEVVDEDEDEEAVSLGLFRSEDITEVKAKELEDSPEKRRRSFEVRMSMSIHEVDEDEEDEEAKAVNLSMGIHEVDEEEAVNLSMSIHEVVEEEEEAKVVNLSIHEVVDEDGDEDEEKAKSVNLSIHEVVEEEEEAKVVNLDNRPLSDIGPIPERGHNEVIAKHSVGIGRWIRSAGPRRETSVPATTCSRAQGTAYLFRSENMPNNILLVDRNVPQYQTIVDSVNASTTPIVYSQLSTKSEILQKIKQTGTKINRLGFCFESNGPTYMFLDEQPLFLDSGPAHYNKNTQFIIDLIKEFNVVNIDFFACDTLRFSDWKHYYDVLFRETGVIVGASDNKTGNLKYGGDWVMESTNQDVEFVYFTENIECYKFLLGSSSNHIHNVTMNGTYGVGKNNNGQLGLGTDGDGYDNNVFTPTTNFPPSGKKVKAISSGETHTIALLDDGNIYATGDNDGGQLGLYKRSYGNYRVVFTQITDFSPSLPSNTKVKAISCGAFHTVALLDDASGTIYATGRNGRGQLGLDHGVVESYTDVFTQITVFSPSLPSNAKVKSISCGDYHTIALLDDASGTIYATGYNEYGQLGLNRSVVESYTDVFTQITVFSPPLPSNSKVKEISCGQNHTVALLDDASGTIYVTGYNLDGQLGLGDTAYGSYIEVFTKIPSFPPIGLKTIAISCGSSHTIALLNDGTIYATGSNNNGQLGIPDQNDNDAKVFTKLTNFPTSGTKVKAISCGSNHTIALLDDGTIYGTGLNSIANKSIFTKISIPNNEFVLSINDMTPIIGPFAPPTITNITAYQTPTHYSYNIAFTSYYTNTVTPPVGTTYSYSTDNWATHTNTNSSPFTITLQQQLSTPISIKEYSESSFSAASNSVSITVGTKPSITSINSGGYTSIIVKFTNSTDGVPSVTKYQYSIKKYKENSYANFKDIGLNSNPFTITGLDAATTYSVIMRAVSESETTTWTSLNSEPASVKTDTLSKPIIQMKSAFTDNSKIFYKPGSLSCGVGSTKNYMHKSKHT